MAPTQEHSPIDNATADVEMQEQSPMMTFAPQPFQENAQPILSQQPSPK
jgi:hypothetical protein